MALDLLDLISKNASLVGMDPEFTGLVAPTAPAGTGTVVTEEGPATASAPTRSYENLTAGQTLGIAGDLAKALMSAIAGNPLSLAKNTFDIATMDPYAAPGMVGQFLDSWLNDFGPVMYGEYFQDIAAGPDTELVSTSPYANALGISPDDWGDVGSDGWGGLGDVGSAGDFSDTSFADAVDATATDSDDDTGGEI